MNSSENRYQRFTSLTTEIARQVQRLKDNEMARRFGLRGKQVQALFMLFQAPEGLSLGRLTELCEDDKSAMSRIVHELVEQDLVYIEDKGEQRYKKPIRLTKKGRAIAEEVTKKIADYVESLSQGVSLADREAFYRTLEIIAGNLAHANEKIA